MKLIILDENQKIINKFEYFDSFWNHKFEKISNVSDIENNIKDLLDTLEYGAVVYKPTEKRDDFYLSYLNSVLKNVSHFKLDDVEGTFLSDILSVFDKNKIILNIIINIYNAKKPQKFFLEYYSENILNKRIKVIINVIDDFLYILSEDETDYFNLSTQQQKLFETDFSAIVIVQEGHIVKVNKKYMEVYKQDDYDHVIGQKLGYTGLNIDTVNRLNENIQKVIDGKMFSYSIPLEIEKNGKLLYYFNLNGNYTIFNDKPAVMLIHYDITEQEINRRELEKKNREALDLQKNFEFIQSVSSTGITYLVGDKYIRSKEFYNLIERDPIKEDIYTDVIWNTVIDEDKHIVKENYEKITLKHDFTDFVVRIKTAKENIKYIHCYLRVNNSENSNDHVVLYQDVTAEQLYLKELKEALNESLRLEKNLKKIQNISKTGMGYYNDRGELEWTKSSFEILKLDEEKYKNYHGDLSEIIVDEDLSYWKEAHEKCSPENPEATFVIRVINGEGNIVYLNCFIVYEYNNNIKSSYKRIIFYQDITEQIERENRLKEALDNSLRLEKNFDKIQGISKTTMCYSDKDGNFTWFNNGYNILGLSSDQYEGNMSEYLIDEDKIIWANAHKSCTPENPETSFVQRAIINNNLIYIRSYVAYEFDEDGNKKSHVSLLQDITEEVKKENRLKEVLDETLNLQNSLNRIQTLSKTAMGYSDGSKYSKWTPEIFNLLEIKPKDYGTNMDNIIERFVIDEDLHVRKEAISKISPEHPDVSFNQRIKTGKGNIKYLKTIIYQDYDDQNNLLDRISFNQDITREVEYQNQLKTAVNDKEVLLTEVHHRVKNNLQIILSLINLNKNYNTAPETILNDTETRIYAMALIHEKIYGSKSLSNVNIKDYVESLVESVLDTYMSNIQFHSDMDSIDLEMDEAIPLGLIINELVVNSIKYAFSSEEEGNLYIQFKEKDNCYCLIVKDDGKGLPDNFDLDNLTNLGLTVVQSLVLQIDGILSLINCNGTGFKIQFNKT